MPPLTTCLPLHSTRRRPVILSLAILLTIVIYYRDFCLAAVRQSAVLSAKSDPLLATQNDTLGFGATILISLPERTDRRDGISLLAAFSNVTITHSIAAVHGDQIVEKARPYGKARIDLDNAHFGSWRSHMDALRYIVDNHIETALILEDDVDWDLSVKPQLKSLAQGLRSSPLRDPWSTEELLRFPYGRDWDILHLAASRVLLAPEPFESVATSYADPFLAPSTEAECTSATAWYCYAPLLSSLHIPAQSRAVVPSYEPLGLTAIAVTLRGAQRLLYLLSWRGLDTGLDWSIRDALKSGEIRGWTIAPPLFGSWAPGGGVGDSDINKGSQGKDVNAEGGNLNGQSKGLRDSTRKRLGEVMEKERYWARLGKKLEVQVVSKQKDANVESSR